MSGQLATYLHDHLAGAKFAVQLLENLRDKTPDAAISQLSTDLLLQIEADRFVLAELAEQIGGKSSTVKEVAAWVAEKASRFKLTVGDLMGTFEAIEALSLGVLGKLALWNALRSIRSMDARLDGVNLDDLITRANQQFAQLENARLRLAELVLPATP